MRMSAFRLRTPIPVFAIAILLALSATATASTDRQNVVTVEVVGKPIELTATAVADITNVAAQLDPPLGGCYLGNVGGTVTGYYTNGVLTRTETTFSSSIDCAATAPGQTMQNLWDMASVNLSTGGSGRGSIGNCDYPNENLQPCVSVQSTGKWICPIGIRCAGEYWVDHETFMTLPSGWYWSSLPADCTLLSSQQISCLISSGRVSIPPNL